MNFKYKNDFGYLRIEYIIGFFLFVRLIGITSAPLEIAHSWRQVTGLMVARNFLEVDPTFWLPRVDETNGFTGIIGMEFPLLNYLHYLVSLVFDYQHWYGRLINLTVTSLGIYFFYKLVKDKLNFKTAYYATIFLLGSVWFMYARKMMPDTFSMSIGFIALYYGNEYLKKDAYRCLILFFTFLTLAFLSKISAVMCIVGIPFLLNGSQSNKTRLHIILGTGISLITTYLWYFQWNPHLSETYGNWYNSGTDMRTGIKELSQNIPETLKRIYFSSFHSYIAFVILVVSTIIIAYRKQFNMIWFLLSACILFGLYMAKSGSIFYIHGYYIIPIVPVFAIIIGSFLASLKNNYIALSIVALFLIESIANQQHDLFIKDKEKYKLSLEKIVSKYTNQDDLIAINGNENPQELYLSHRKGSLIDNADLMNEHKINSLRLQGCKFLVVNRHNFSGNLNHHKVFENRDYTIYKIED